jgi:hypothetical protein
MKKFVFALVAVVAGAMAMQAGVVHAQKSSGVHPGGGGGSHQGSGGHSGHWGGYYGGYRGVYPGFGLYFGAPWYGYGVWPGYYAGVYPYGYYPYPYAPYRVYDAAPTVYVEPEMSAAPAVEPANFWYYCTNPAGYYPYVQNCSLPWMKVVPPSPSSSAPPEK